MTNKITNIYLVGVGGQGTLLASEILSEVLMLAGHDIKKAEVHGMAQRGGSVVSHVRFGEKVFSPIIPEGEGDILFGFELLETYRCLSLLRPDAAVVVNNMRVLPPGVTLGVEEYPPGLEEKILQTFPRTTIVAGLDLAAQAGSDRTVNIVLLGALARRMAIEQDLWLQAIRNMVPERFLEQNLKAFQLGLEAA